MNADFPSPHIPRATRTARRRAGIRRFYRNTTGSTVIPGLGLIPTRLRPLGWVLTGGFALSVLGVLYVVLTRGVVHTVLALSVSPSRLLVVLVVVVVVAVLWCAGILATAWLTRPRQPAGGDRWLMQAFVVLCCLVIAAPSVVAVRYLTIQRSLVDTVFSSSTTATDGGHPDVVQDDPWAKVPRVNVLLLGSDAGPDRTGVRPDSIMVASIDTRTGNTTLIGVPRSLRHVPFPASSPLYALFPDGFDCDLPSDPCWLNKVWSVGEEHKSLYPGVDNPGLAATRDAVSATLGLEISHSVVIDLSGFSQLVAAMGGVEINVKERVCMGCKRPDPAGPIVWAPGKHRYIEPGLQHLDGYQALWYARSRALSDDNSRIRRQRCVAGALLKQVNPVRLLTNYASIADAIKTHVVVDIPQRDLPAWADLVTRIQKGHINSVALTNDVVPSDHPDFAEIRALVQEGLSAESAGGRPTASRSAPPTSTTGSTTSPTSTTPRTSPTTSSGVTSLASAC